MDTKYRAIRAAITISMEMAVGSGVIMAATKEEPTRAHFHTEINCLELTSPVKDRAKIMMGSWKHSPMYKRMVLTSEM
jgi:hypothetical protein